MSLEGSLETIALPDVLSLLASSRKTGELRVVGESEGRLWLQDGQLIGSRVGRAKSHVDALFELLRLDTGQFSFADGLAPPSAGKPSRIEPVMREAQQRIDDWRDLEASIPSLDIRVRLCPELPAAEVTVAADQWRVLAFGAAGLSVREIADELALSEFEARRAMKALVDAGLVTVLHGAAAAPPKSPTVAPPAVAAADDVSPEAPAKGPARWAGLAAPDEKPAAGDAVEPAATQVPIDDTTAPGAGGQDAPTADHPIFRTAPERASLARPALPAPSSRSASSAEAARSRRARRVMAAHDDLALGQAVSPGDGPGPKPLRQVVSTAVPGPDAELDDVPDDEPINRGLLLKFLSSVRS